ncbi:metallophosphoesterase [Desulfomonile tiedjei]|uniref:Calcineurin-like phosphoesterase domain-containing protein n=1 Tax=Desulfomonile tiedjei (strain ATCC 49306 / DSM 6799 / DCB-1) TaxID=706587 RepID=I4CD74_DESTA|nr:metallophosphoesterase [Desulfomonile tiedjei]AFM27515.1 hypothetical protein Desti_4901 [Desulfomonile tiedjei DSM 6799]
MSEIQYICLSDLHLGEEDSILSSMKEDGVDGDPCVPGPVLKELAACIKDLIGKFCGSTRKPILVLNGDTLELALCPIHQATMAFQCFISELHGDKGFPFDKIVMVPGNHDHHLWEMTREDQYRDYLQRHPEVVKLPEQWHSTKMFAGPDDNPISHYLTDMIQRPPLKMDMKLEVAYPNYGLITEKTLGRNKDPKKCVVFHHGHFTEWIYSAMSTVNGWIFEREDMSQYPWDIEKGNFAWIDFAWSALGQSGPGLETVYEKALDNREFGQVIANFSAGLAKEVGTRTFDWFEGAVIDKFLSLIYRGFGGAEKGHSDAPLSPDGLKQLFRYMEGPLHAQIRYEILAIREKKNELKDKDDKPDFFKGEVAPPTTFIFGHTHKPYMHHEAFAGYKDGVDVYNSGGWVVDTLDPNPLHGGSIVLVDDRLNVAAINMYKETKNNSISPIEFERLPSSSPSPVMDEIGRIQFAQENTWRTFSEVVAQTIPIRRKYLRKRVFSSLRT